MPNLLRRLPANARILDLGCGNGSYDASGLDATVIGVDLEGDRRLYRCGQCETMNLFTRDEHYPHLSP